METLVGGRRRTEKLERCPGQELTLEEILRCLRASTPDTGISYNRTLNLVGNLLQRTNAYIPITWLEGIEMKEKVRGVMDACPPDILNDIGMVRERLGVESQSAQELRQRGSGQPKDEVLPFYAIRVNGRLALGNDGNRGMPAAVVQGPRDTVSRIPTAHWGVQ